MPIPKSISPILSGASVAVLEELISRIPKISPLDGVDPFGRVDVAASRVAAKVAGIVAGEVPQLGVLAGVYPILKPGVDTLLERYLGPGPGKPKRRAKRQHRTKSKKGVIV